MCGTTRGASRYPNVSILVLVDVGLRCSFFHSFRSHQSVSILVLVDVGLR